uniref:Indoleamine 2,3-dioxygenase n=1 Tax=Biomphalaria glabrata TaxID=6526 RepID=A0A2C9LC41_BIOGL
MPNQSVNTNGIAGRSQSFDFNLNSFKISVNFGFLVENPLTSLPTYFNPWNTLAEQLPELYKAKRVREAVHELPLLDYNQLSGHRQLRLAHLQLSFITAGYVWQNGEAGIPKSLPKSLAVPFYRISELLGMQPVLCHAGLALANWRLKDPNGAFDFENLQCIYHLPGGYDGDWFCIIPFMVEFNFAKCLKNFVEILNLLNVAEVSNARDAALTDIENRVALQLDEINKVIQMMTKSLTRMHDHLDAKTFFNEVRPFLAGWGGEGTPLPDGLVYEGISTTPIKMLGDSAAQSSTNQALDGLLGVEHKKSQRDVLVKMRNYMPPEHKRFVEYLENRPYGLRNLVESSTNDVLKSSYNNCITALVQMRTYHIHIVSKYIIVASKGMNEGNYKSLDSKGTGGTSVMPFLKDVRADTETKMIGSRQSKKSWLTIGAVTAVGVAVIFGAVRFFKQK